MIAQLSDLSPGGGRPDADAVSGNGRAGALSILLVDDDSRIAAALDVALRLAGHSLHVASDAEGAVSMLARQRFDAVLLDLNYTPGRTNGDEGLALLARILADDPGIGVVVVTAHSGVRIAVAAMQAGARDFVMKPWRNADLIAKLAAASVRIGAPAPLATPGAAPPRILGDSAGMVQVRDRVRRLGPTLAGVVVTGPVGSGRRLVAAALHAASARADRPLVSVDLRDPADCDRLHGADATVLLTHPDRLDEVAQDRLAARLHPNARVIAIARKSDDIVGNLARRAASVEIAVPPLSRRGGDAALLARHFARMFAERHARPPLGADVLDAVLAIRWPDDVHGLAAAVERAVLLGVVDVPQAAPAPRYDLAGNERATIAAALRDHHHNVTLAATALGLSRPTLYRRMSRHGL